MPKISLIAALESLTGTLDGVVFKPYRKDKRGLVLSRKTKCNQRTLARRPLWCAVS
jgi:hypothetical protein